MAGLEKVIRSIKLLPTATAVGSNEILFFLFDQGHIGHHIPIKRKYI